MTNETTTRRWIEGWVAALTMIGCLSVGVGPAFACPCDCNGDGIVSNEEVALGVQIGLGQMPVAACPQFDQTSDGSVTVEEIVLAALSGRGCPAEIIETVAGTGLAGFDGDGREPTSTALYLPQDVTVGPDGNLYLVDWNNHRIRQVVDGAVVTIAGTGELGQPSNDAEALYAQFNHPTNVEFDHQGRLVIASWHNSIVTRLDPETGKVAIIAGNGARSFGGDGGPGPQAALDLPSSVVIDSEGNIIISDQANFRIRKLAPDGTISTMCGTGVPGDSGDGGPAVLAQLNAEKGQSAPPAGRVAIDSQDRIYIADSGNHRVRRIDTDGTIITIAGTGEPGYNGDGGLATEAQLNQPRDVAVASNGIVYIADTANNVIRMVRPDGIISTYAGTGTQGYDGDLGPATLAELNRPYGIGIAPNGVLYVADTHNQRVRRISSYSDGPREPPTPTPTPEIIPCTDVAGSICTYAGNGETGFSSDGRDRLESALYWPFDIEFTPSGRRVILDWNNHRIREILSDDTLQTIVGTDFLGDGPVDLSDLTEPGAPPLSVDLNHPTDVLELSNGDLIFTAWHNHKIRLIDRVTGLVRVLMGRGASFLGDGGPAKSALVNQPPHAAFDPQGNLFLIDQRNQRIRVLYDFDQARENAIITTVLGNPDPPAPGTLPRGGYNGDPIPLQTKVSFLTGGNPEPSGGIAVDPNSTPENTVIYFADTNNHLIRRVQFTSSDFKTGVVQNIAGSPGVPGFAGDGGPSVDSLIALPGDMEIGPDGNLYFADTNNHRIRMINLEDGTIHTVVGTGTKGYSGDGGPALEAQLNRPFGVAFDQNGDLFVSDTFNSRVRKVKLP